MPKDRAIAVLSRLGAPSLGVFRGRVAVEQGVTRDGGVEDSAAMTSQPMRAGFVGAGQMGAPMVRRLAAAGTPTTVYARRAEVRDEFAAEGLPTVSTLAEAAAGADVVIACLYSDAQVLEVALGDDGLIASMEPGSVLALHTTGSPATAQRLAEAGAPRRVHVVDAPVSGGAHDIAAGRLTVMLGGEPDDVERVRSVVAAYADPIFVIGALGTAQVVKLLNNALFAAHVELVADAERVAGQFGIDPVTLATVIQASSGASNVMGLALRGGSIHQLVQGAGHYLAKDFAAVRAVTDELGVDLGVIRRAVEEGPVTFEGRDA